MLLHDFIKAKVKKNQGAQKELAVVLDKSLRDADSAVEFSTLTAKVSKLLNGKREGRDFFFDSHHACRKQALAAALGVEVDDLSRLAEQTVLVLDPALGADAIAFLDGRAKHAQRLFTCVVVKATPDVLDALRDHAQEHKSAVVVLASPADLAFFKGAKVAATTLVKVPRGWQVVGHEDLYPLPPPPPPRLFDEAGRVRIPIEKPDSAKLALLSGDTRARVEHQIEQGEVPDLSLYEVAMYLGYWDGNRYETRSLYSIVSQGRIDYSELPDKPKCTWIWDRNGRLYAWGELAAEFRSFVAPYHVAHQAPWLAVLARLAPQLADPWCLEKILADDHHPDMRALTEAVTFDGDGNHRGWNSGSTSALDPATAKAWLKGHAKTCRESGVNAVNRGYRLNEFCSAFEPTRHALVAPCPSVYRMNDDQEAQCRSELRQLLTHGARATELGIELLRALQMAHDAPVLIGPRDSAKPDYVFDLGAGNLLQVRQAPMLGSACEFRAVGEFMFERGTDGSGSGSERHEYRAWYGGDVMLLVRWFERRWLEGSSSVAKRRRDRAAATYSEDDD